LLEAARATLGERQRAPLIARVILAVFARPWLLRPALLGARAFRGTRIPAALARRCPADSASRSPCSPAAPRRCAPPAAAPAAGARAPTPTAAPSRCSTAA
jgi:hypothetical protein